MKEVLVLILKVAAPISVALLMFAQGLAIDPKWVGSYFRERPWLILRSVIAALVLVPAAALAVILVLKPAIGPAVGLAILVSCPPAPLMLMTAPKKGGASAAFMATMHLSLAALAFLTVPAVLYVLSLQLGFKADVDLGAMAMVLTKTILGPLGLGLAVHTFAPSFAEKRGPLFGKIGSIILLLALVILVLAIFPAMIKMDAWSYFVFAVVSAVALAIGHLVGPDDPQEKTALAVECGVRHPALALAIGGANFTPQKALPVLVPCVITFIVVATIYLTWRGKTLAGGKPGKTPAAPERASA
jgi:BASS family bile acid:Na+ symporter